MIIIMIMIIIIMIMIIIIIIIIIIIMIMIIIMIITNFLFFGIAFQFFSGPVRFSDMVIARGGGLTHSCLECHLLPYF